MLRVSFNSTSTGRNMTFAIDALRTASPYFNHKGFTNEVTEFIGRTATLANKAKRAAFYITSEQHDPGTWTPVDTNLIHGLLGIVSEAGELLQALQAPGEELDMVNVQEELGDMLWYLNLMVSSCGKTQAELEVQLLAKLRARYPEKFSVESALVRDLDAERTALETN